MLFSIEQEGSGSISGSAVWLFPSGQLFPGMYGLGISVFQSSLVLFSDEAPALFWLQVLKFSSQQGIGL